MNEKVKIYYDEMVPPKHIRLVSEMLCMDYSFNPMLSSNPIGFENLVELSQSSFFDHIFVVTKKGSAYMVCSDNGELDLLDMENQLIDLKECELYDFSELQSERRKIRMNKNNI